MFSFKLQIIQLKYHNICIHTIVLFYDNIINITLYIKFYLCVFYKCIVYPIGQIW